jgi:hypothetical protein
LRNVISQTHTHSCVFLHVFGGFISSFWVIELGGSKEMF